MSITSQFILMLAILLKSNDDSRSYIDCMDVATRFITLGQSDGPYEVVIAGIVRDHNWLTVSEMNNAMVMIQEFVVIQTSNVETQSSYSSTDK